MDKIRQTGCSWQKTCRISSAPCCPPNIKAPLNHIMKMHCGVEQALKKGYHWTIKYPIRSMYGIFTYIWWISMVNVGKYTIHGYYGYQNTNRISVRVLRWFPETSAAFPRSVREVAIIWPKVLDIDWLVVSTHLKKIESNWIISPNFRGENKNIWNHRSCRSHRAGAVDS